MILKKYSNINKRKSTFRILFYLKRKVIKMDGTGQLCVVSLLIFSCKLNVKPKQWNVKEGKIFGRNADDRLLNNQIKVIRKSICRHYENIFNGIGPPTAERVKIAYWGLDRYNRTLLQVFENHNKEYELLLKNGVREFSTYWKYCYVYKYLEEFLYCQYKLKDIALIDIRSCFIIDFELYLRGKRRCSSIYIAPLKRMISIAQSNGWLDYNPFSSYHIPAQWKEREYLVMSKVEAIINVVFTRRKKLYELIQDFFIFCVFTGVSYVDLAYLTKENLKKFDDGLWLCFERGGKTEKRIQKNALIKAFNQISVKIAFLHPSLNICYYRKNVLKLIIYVYSVFTASGSVTFTFTRKVRS